MDPAQVTRGHGLLEGFLARRRADRADSLIPAGTRSGRLLDVGCGTYPYFLTRTKVAERWGVDRVLPGEQSVTTPEGVVRLVPFDAERDLALPFPDGHFSVITMLAFFEHVKPPALGRLLVESRRVLLPEGSLIITTPAHWTGGLLKLLAVVGIVSRAEIDEHVDTYAHATVRYALESAGYDRAQIRQGYFELLLNTWTVAVR